MITTIVGDILAAPKGIMVHGCNAQGVMGSGLALQVRNQYPQIFRLYRNKYEQLGNRLFLGTATADEVRSDFWIMNGITQQEYGREPGRVYVDYKALERVFVNAAFLAYAQRLPVLFPLIGCGLAGGDWKKVRKIIDETVPDAIGKFLYVLTEADIPKGMK